MKKSLKQQLKQQLKKHIKAKNMQKGISKVNYKEITDFRYTEYLNRKEQMITKKEARKEFEDYKKRNNLPKDTVMLEQGMEVRDIKHKCNTVVLGVIMYSDEEVRLASDGMQQICNIIPRTVKEVMEQKKK